MKTLSHKRLFFGRKFLCLFAFVLLMPELAYAVGTLSGVITSQATGLPVAFATVTIGRNGSTAIVASATTAANGSYTLTNLNPGNYTLRATAAGFQNRTIGAKVTNNQNRVVNLSLGANPGAIAGQVIDTTTLLPISGSTVEVFRDGIFVANATTNASGNYTISGLFAGSFSVTASAAAHASSTTGAIVQNSQTTTVNFSLA